MYPRQLADVNGDGMADIVGFGSDGGDRFAGHRRRTLRTRRCSKSTTSPSSRRLEQPGQLSAAAGRRERRRHGGYRRLRQRRGDGFAGHRRRTLRIAGVGIDNFTVQCRTAGPARTNILRQLADVNGDGMADIVGFGTQRGDRFRWPPAADISLSRCRNPKLRLQCRGLDQPGSITAAARRRERRRHGRYRRLRRRLACGVAGHRRRPLRIAGRRNRQLRIQCRRVGQSKPLYPRAARRRQRRWQAPISIGFAHDGVLEALSNGFHLV